MTLLSTLPPGQITCRRCSRIIPASQLHCRDCEEFYRLLHADEDAIEKSNVAFWGPHDSLSHSGEKTVSAVPSGEGEEE